VTAGTSGVRFFCGTEDGVVHYGTAAAAVASHDACTGASVLQ
jgi:hypothetical protein